MTIPYTLPQNILVVDDDPAIRRILFRFLIHEGHRVLLAATGEEALDLWKHFRGSAYSLHLLIADFNLPRMNGRELAGRILALDAKTKILYISGQTDRNLDTQEAPAQGQAFLKKPFTREDLACKICNLLHHLN